MRLFSAGRLITRMYNVFGLQRLCYNIEVILLIVKCTRKHRVLDTIRKYRKYTVQKGQGALVSSN